MGGFFPPFPPNPHPLSSSSWRERVQRLRWGMPWSERAGLRAERGCRRSPSPRDVNGTNTKEQTDQATGADRMTDALPERQNRRHSGAGTLPVTQRVPRPGERRATHSGGALSWGARSGRGAPRTRCRPQYPGSRSGGAKGAGPRPTPPPRSPEPRHQLSGARRPKQSGCGMRIRRAPVGWPQKGKFGGSKKKKVLGGRR